MSSKNVWMGVLGGVLAVGVAGSVALSAVSISEIRSLRKWAVAKEAELAEEQSDETKEDGVVIAENYTIEPTLQISDAYKSGDTSQLSDADKETLDMAKDVIKEVIKDGMSDYEKEEAIYLWMAKNINNGDGMLTVIPSTSQENAIPHGVLKNHHAVCVGYATTFRMFMQMMDIECKVVHNTEKYHSWDLVKLDDAWYHVDIYSDAGTANYANFNQNDTMRAMGNEWDTEFFPKAESLKYNHSYQAKKDCDSVYKIPKILRKAFDKKEGYTMIDFGKDISEEDRNIAYRIVSMIDNFSMENDMSVTGFYVGTYNWMQDPETESYILCVSANFPTEDQGYTDLSEEVIKKIQDAIKKSFEDLGYTDYSGMDGMYDEGADSMTAPDGSTTATETTTKDGEEEYTVQTQEGEPIEAIEGTEMPH